MSPEILLSILSHWEHDMLNCQCHFETVSPTTSELADLFRSPPVVSILNNNPELKSQIESLFDKMVRYTVWTKITGAWDTKRQRLLSNANLARVAHETDLVGCTVVNPRNPVQASTKLAANVVEAVIGAVWLDSDESMSAVRQVMETLGLGLNGMTSKTNSPAASTPTTCSAPNEGLTTRANETISQLSRT
ncbi:hypothetical protein JADG_005778 [Aureobasidium aubasidani]|nr:hypothetical protein JADG_005778 [Aureobasidium pullulans]